MKWVRYHELLSVNKIYALLILIQVGKISEYSKVKMSRMLFSNFFNETCIYIYFYNKVIVLVQCFDMIVLQSFSFDKAFPS